ncbi:MAG: nascent polypeptide-associated complex protein [Candidatus Bathyarchaeia archaeon]
MGFRRMRGVPSGREALRALKRMGMQFDELEGVSRVSIELPDRRIIIEGPIVAAITIQGQRMYQISGGIETEEPIAAGAPEAAPPIRDEDVELVAQQAGVGPEEARRALEESGGDLAKAIISLKGGRGAT